MDMVISNVLSNDSSNTTKYSYCMELPEFLQICTDYCTKTNEEKTSILQDYNEKLASFSEDECFCEFEYQCLYGLYYNYKNMTLSTVSQTLFAWFKVCKMSCVMDPCNCMVDLCDGTFLSELRQFTDLYTNPEGVIVLKDAFCSCISLGHIGLTKFLIKFGLFDFELSVENIVVLGNILEKFNMCLTVHGRTELEVLVPRIARSNFTFRRALLTFIAIYLLAHYSSFERIARLFENEVFEELKCSCYPKFMCLDLLLSATVEPDITLTDIKYFIETILNPERNEEYFSSNLLGTFEKIYGIHNYTPRSLKDLTRCRIRSSLQNSSLLPAEINQLAIPDPLKEFLLFQSEEIWNMFEENYRDIKYLKSCLRSLEQTRNIFRHRYFYVHVQSLL